MEKPEAGESYRENLGSFAGYVETAVERMRKAPSDKRAEEVTDYLSAKPRLENILGREKRKEAFNAWVEKKKEEVKIVIPENNLNPGINKAKYDEASGE